MLSNSDRDPLNPSYYNQDTGLVSGTSPNPYLYNNIGQSYAAQNVQPVSATNTMPNTTAPNLNYLNSSGGLQDIIRNLTAMGGLQTPAVTSQAPATTTGGTGQSNTALNSGSTDYLANMLAGWNPSYYNPSAGTTGAGTSPTSTIPSWTNTSGYNPGTATTNLTNQLGARLTQLLNGNGLTPEYINAMRQEVLGPSQENLSGNLNRMGAGVMAPTSGLMQELLRRNENSFNNGLVTTGFNNINSYLQQMLGLQGNTGQAKTKQEEFQNQLDMAKAGMTGSALQQLMKALMGMIPKNKAANPNAPPTTSPTTNPNPNPGNVPNYTPSAPLENWSYDDFANMINGISTGVDPYGGYPAMQPGDIGSLLGLDNYDPMAGVTPAQPPAGYDPFEFINTFLMDMNYNPLDTGEAALQDYLDFTPTWINDMGISLDGLGDSSWNIAGEGVPIDANSIADAFGYYPEYYTASDDYYS